MKFNNDKFMRGTNYSCTYSDWSKELMDVLKESGNSSPKYENGKHIFIESVRKEGKHKRSKMFYIVCPCNGSDISVQIVDKMDKEECEMAMRLVINFIAVMEKHGYIIN